ncbi:MAG: hypothetical protein AB7O80_24820 [Acetobacteraceae bacterium]
MSRTGSRVLLSLLVLVGLGGCVAYGPGHGYRHAGGYYHSAAPTYVAPRVRHSDTRWWGGHEHRPHHRRHHDRW